MLSGRLIKEARLRSALTQAELGKRLNRPQSVIGRWERGEVLPSLETEREVIRACGLELAMELRVYDDSYRKQASELLPISPRERLRIMVSSANEVEGLARQLRAAKQGIEADVSQQIFDPVSIFQTLHKSNYVLIGQLAGVIRGSPILPTDFEIAIVPAEGKKNFDQIRFALRKFGGELWQRDCNPAIVLPRNKRPYPDAERWIFEQNSAVVALVNLPHGTRGYADLSRQASWMAVTSKLKVQVATLLDLARMADAALRPAERSGLVAFRATAELQNS